MAAKRNGGRSASEKKEKVYSWWWLVFIVGMTWFLTGFPSAFIRPKWVEARATVSEAPYGVSASSWRQDLTLTITDRLLAWGNQHGIPETTLRGAFRAASLERDATGKPSEGTGNRVDAFTILAITSIESSLGSGEVNPEESNPTGHCRAWSELVAHKLLNGVGEVAALRKIVQPLGYSEWRVYGSCGAGCIGWTQALPSNWWNLMGPGFDPWSREDAAEFTARYLTVHGYFTQGQRYAVHAYNPNAADSVYTLPVVRKAEELGQSFADAGLSTPEVTISQRGGLSSEIAKVRLDSLFGVPYKDFGYRDDSGSWCVWTGGESAVDGVKGLNCGGFVLEAARAIYGPISLQTVGTKRSDREDPTENGDWLWFGYDEVMNLSDFLGGQVLIVEGLDWQKGSGFVVSDWGEILFQEGYLYLGSLNVPNAVAGRKHHHVVAVLPVGGEVLVYEATNYYGSGVQRISLEDLQSKYQALNADYRMLIVQVSLQTDGQTTWSVTVPAGQEVTLTLRETPVLKAALWTGKTLETLRTANEIGGYVPEGLVKRFDQLLGLLGKLENVLDRLHAVLSVWSIAGQPRELKLDPLLNWRILSLVE